MRTERIVSHQLLSDLFRKVRIESARDVNSGQFRVFAGRVCFEFAAFEIEFGIFDVRL